MKKEYDFIIIGAGPAGMTAAIYASEQGLRLQCLKAALPVENY